MMRPGDIIFTKRCPFCGEVIRLSELECPSCRDKIPESGVRKIGGYKCACAFPYTGMFREAVLNYKFYGKHSYGRAFASYMTEAVKARLDGCDFDVVTYVPVYGEKPYRFNHSRTLAKHISRLLCLPCEPLLVKIKRTQKQHSLSVADRRHNVRGAFSSPELSGRRVLVVDDIITTGYTLAECIRTLKHSGAQSVCCVTLCSAKGFCKI